MQCDQNDDNILYISVLI